MTIQKERTQNHVSACGLGDLKSTIRFSGDKKNPYIEHVEVYDKGTLIWRGNSGEFFSLFILNKNV